VTPAQKAVALVLRAWADCPGAPDGDQTDDDDTMRRVHGWCGTSLAKVLARYAKVGFYVGTSVHRPALPRGAYVAASDRHAEGGQAMKIDSELIADFIETLLDQQTAVPPVLRVLVYGPVGTPQEGRVVASHVRWQNGLRGFGEPREGAPPAIVDLGGTPVMFGVDGWELRRWGEPMPRDVARCLCPEAGASEAAPS
jgi:hypothetical protein